MDFLIDCEKEVSLCGRIQFDVIIYFLTVKSHYNIDEYIFVIKYTKTHWKLILTNDNVTKVFKQNVHK